MGTLTFANRVKETSATTGTGTLSLAGAVTGFRTFVAGHGDGFDCIYVAESSDQTEWEVGRGTVTDAATDTLSRDTVILSSNANALVSFTQSITVYSTAPAEWLSLLHTKGDLAASTGSAATRLAVGSDGKILTAASGEATGLAWGSGPLTTKGDLFTYSTTGARLAIGADNTVLTADSNEATGIKWAAAAGGGGTPWEEWIPEEFVAHGANPAAFYTRNGVGVMGYDDSTEEASVVAGTGHVDLGAGDVTLTIYWLAASATTGDVVWGAAFEVADSTDLDSDSFASERNAAAVTCSGTSGIYVKSTITFTLAQADGLAAVSPFRLKIARKVGDAGDTMTGDAQIIRATLEQ